MDSKTQTFSQQLKNPFPKNVLHFRIGATSKQGNKAIPLFYITARDVEKRLDEVCGPDGWSFDLETIKSDNKTVAIKGCLGVRFPNKGWVYRSDIGEISKTAAYKGGASDSLKRCAVQFGIGRYLYYLENRWVPIDSYKQFTSDPRESLPNWALPSKIKNWEDIAESELDGADGVDLENLATPEENELLKKSAEVRKAILARGKES